MKGNAFPVRGPDGAFPYAPFTVHSEPTWPLRKLLVLANCLYSANKEDNKTHVSDKQMGTARREALRLTSPMTGRQCAIFLHVYMSAGGLPDSQKNPTTFFSDRQIVKDRHFNIF